MVMTKKKAVLYTILISAMSSIVSFGVLILFYGVESWVKNLVVALILFMVSSLSTYRYFSIAFNLELNYFEENSN